MFVNSDFSDLLKCFSDNSVSYLVVGGFADENAWFKVRLQQTPASSVAWLRIARVCTAEAVSGSRSCPRTMQVATRAVGQERPEDASHVAVVSRPAPRLVNVCRIAIIPAEVRRTGQEV